MRKNKMMRLASVILVLTLLSTCAISGTFAKYTTKASATDTARVAKFGVTLTATDASSFSDTYAIAQPIDGKNITYSVDSDDGDKVVAPGTSDSTGVTFTISGTPEVATKVDIAMNVESDIYVKTGTGENATEYYPVVFTLKQGETEVAKGNLTAIKTAVENYAKTAYYGPNTDLSASFTLTWAWDFDDNGAGTNDGLDTMLGNIAAFGVESIPTGYEVSTTLKYDITFTVTQVD